MSDIKQTITEEPKSKEEKANERAKARYWNKRDEIRAKQNQKLADMSPEEYENHRQYFNEYMAQYRKDNAEYLRQQHRKSREKNREETNRRAREKHAKDPSYKREKERQWRKNNPEKAKIKNTTARLNRRARGGYRLKICEVMQVKNLYNGICFYCKRDDATDIEHRLPLSRGGTNEMANLCLACRQCNLRKGKMTDSEFIARGILEGFLKKEDHEK